MATRAANKRLTREYKSISENPPPYIQAKPSDSNILEWHYIITGPENTPYHGGQYWGTLLFPPTYPFAPPAIKMHTPSGRFQPSTRLCLSISDFHPKSFNPAWEVSTILIGLLSFMTSEEMTTGSVSATESERKYLASRTRWWNSTGGGSASNKTQRGNIKAGDGGKKFQEEFPDIHKENLAWMDERKVDLATGKPAEIEAEGKSCVGGVNKVRRPSGSAAAKLVVEGGRQAGGTWLGRNKLYIVAALIFGYVLVARYLGGADAAA